jgi:hypothetical protein
MLALVRYTSPIPLLTLLLHLLTLALMPHQHTTLGLVCAPHPTRTKSYTHLPPPPPHPQHNDPCLHPSRPAVPTLHHHSLAVSHQSPEAHPSRPGASSWRSRMAEAPAAPTGPPGTYTRQPGPNAAAGGPAGLLQRGTAESNKTAVGPGAAGLSAAAGPAKPWSVISSTPLAGGLLQVVVWEGRRNIRVWLPPGGCACVSDSSHGSSSVSGKLRGAYYNRSSEKRQAACSKQRGSDWLEMVAGLLVYLGQGMMWAAARVQRC